MLAIFVIGSIFIALLFDVKYLLPFYSIAGNILLGSFVLLKNRESKVNLSFALTALLTALWACSLFFYNEATSILSALIWCKLSLALYAYLPIPFMCFFSEFPEEDIVPKTYQMVAWMCVATFFAAISASNLIVKDIIQMGDKFIFVAGPAFVLFVLYFLGFIFFAFNRLIEKYRSYKGIKKQQITYVLTGFFLGIIFPVITNFLMPLFGYSSLAAFGAFSTIFTILIISFAITKSQLMDISIFISRALAEVIAVVLLGTVYLGMTYLYKHYFSERIDLAFLGFTVLFGIVVGQAHQPLRLFLQTTSEKLFIRGKYDYYKELSDASVHVVEKLSLSHILSTLYSTFIDVMEISNPRVLLPENFADTGKSSNRYVVYHKKTLLPENDGQEIKFDSHLVRDLMERRQPLFGVEDAKAPLVVPCMLENRLIAIFALGPKLSEDSYTNEDIRLLQVLASQAAVALDHTRSYEKIEADLEIASKQLERSQRLASLGTLTAGVTHEIRNPLTVVRAETERLTSQNRDLEYLKNYKELVIKHITRIEGIVERMLGLAREKQREEGNVSLNELLESILQLFKFNGVNLKKELQTVPSIKGNVQEIEQIFVNLVQNAIEAMPEGGQLTVKTYPQWGRVVVEVADTGKGIPKELQEKIFDPFFSTRHEGTGLGLSIAYRIIREHGGDIKVDSEVGKGTTFKVLF